MKTIVVRLFVLMLLSSIAVPVWAQEKIERDDQQKSQAAAPAQSELPHPWPQMSVFDWNSPGLNPLIKTSDIPGFGKGNKEVDYQIMQSVALCDERFKEECELFRQGLVGLNRGEEFDPETMKEILAMFQYRDFDEVVLQPGQELYGPMAFGGGKSPKGETIVQIWGRAKPLHPVEAYVTRPFRPRRGVWSGLNIVLVIPKVCFNVAIDLRPYVEETQVVAELPKEPSVGLFTPRGRVEVFKTWLDPDGEETRVPNDGIPLVFEARPLDGGTPIRVTSFDRRTAVIEGLELGKRYIIREEYNSDRWEVQGPPEVEIQVGEQNQPIRFDNVQVSRRGGAPLGAARFSDDRSHWDKHKWIYIGLGAVAAGTAIALTRGGKEEINVYNKGGVNNPGGSPASTAPVGSRGFTVGFSIGIR